MKGINPNIYPKDGFWFKESDGARIFGDSWAGVVARVIAYRRRSKIPEGNARQDVITQACQRNPNLCIEDNGVTQAIRKRASLKSMILNWMIRLLERKTKSGLDYVDAGTQARRAEVCIKCVKNAPISSGCASCEATLKAQRENLLSGRPASKNIFACSELGEYIPVSSWLDEQALDNDALPEECWRRRSL